MEIFQTGAKDMAENCREMINDPDRQSTTIVPQQWALVSVGVNVAEDINSPVIQLLDCE